MRTAKPDRPASLRRRALLAGGFVGLGTLAMRRWVSPLRAAPAAVFDVAHSDDEWRQLLSPQQYRVLRREGTELPFSSPLDAETRRGRFACAGCRLDLFSSATKYDSGTGWPSFWQPLPDAVASRVDYALGMQRDEVHCRRCGGHLGHVFDDGPPPTGLRYCMNGVALAFEPA